MKKETRLESLIKQLNQLYDEYEDLQEEFHHCQGDDELIEDIKFRMSTCEIAMFKLEIEIELLRK